MFGRLRQSSSALCLTAQSELKLPLAVGHRVVAFFHYFRAVVSECNCLGNVGETIEARLARLLPSCWIVALI